MMPLYENLVIGNFLFGLGIKVGARSDEMFTPGFGLHLMQQTPLDIVLGDVLLAGPRAVALLEFKRAADRRSKERGKLAKLNALLENATFKVLQDTSRRIHFYVETEDLVEQGCSRVLPYLDLSTDDLGGTLEELMDDLASRASGAPELSSPQIDACQRYLELVCVCQGRSYRPSPGILIGVGGDGKIAFAPLDDVRNLRSTFGAIRTQEMRLAQEIDRMRIERTRQQLRISRGQDRSISMSMSRRR
jgi:hypothetical protein